MKLRNKKTGKVIEWFNNTDGIFPNSLAELNAEWEDVLEEPKDFYVVEQRGTVGSRFRTGAEYEKKFKEIGNCFETKEEAEKAVEKLKAWKRLKDKGFKIRLRGWKGNSWLEANWGKLEGDYSDVLLLFGGEK